MQANRTDRLKTVILLLAVAGLTSGLAVWFAGRTEIADMIWIAGVAPALAAPGRRPGAATAGLRRCPSTRSPRATGC